MNDVKLNRHDLLGVLRSNRDKHVTTYDEAMVGYVAQREAAFKALQRCVNGVSGNLDELVNATQIKLSAVTGLIKPQSHVESYDQEIAMVSMSVEDIIELDAGQFAQYVMDKWSWKKAFEATTSSYTGR